MWLSERQTYIFLFEVIVHLREFDPYTRNYPYEYSPLEPACPLIIRKRNKCRMKIDQTGSTAA